MILLHFEKILNLSLQPFMDMEELEVSLELIFDNLTSSYYQERLLEVRLSVAFAFLAKYFYRICHLSNR